MKFKNELMLLLLFSTMAVFSTSCSKNDDSEPDDASSTIEPSTIKEESDSSGILTVLVQNLPADPVTRDLNNGDIIGDPTNHFTFFKFSDHEIIPHEDSASTKWDIGFHGTDIILNDEENGPGEAEGLMLEGALKEIKEAPEDGYKTGTIFPTWFNYNEQNHVINAKPGYTLIIHTNDNKYVKMEIISYYNGLPSHPSVKSHQRYYTFRYTIQQDGSRSFITKK